jgi:heme oxygenase (biliverdin-IX-beta and delta-forming)
MSQEPRPGILRETTPEAIQQARRIIRSARFAALAALDPETGHPLASRVGLACLDDGTPFTVISALASHTGALRADPRCSLLVGETGKGDPLAYARLTLVCTARFLDPGSTEAAEARARYLAAQPKATLYIELPDFRFVRFDIGRASFNAGFGKAYALEGAELIG